MNHIAALVAICALSSASCAPVMTGPTLHARATWRWDNVISLPPGAYVRVTTDHGSHEGTFIAADDATLSVQTRQGSYSSRATLVQRVERIEPPTGRSRARRALISAAGGTAVTVFTVAMLCQALGGRPCAPSPKAIALSAALYGGFGAMPESRRAMTIYERP